MGDRVLASPHSPYMPISGVVHRPAHTVGFTLEAHFASSPHPDPQPISFRVVVGRDESFLTSNYLALSQVQFDAHLINSPNLDPPLGPNLTLLRLEHN